MLVEPRSGAMFIVIMNISTHAPRMVVQQYSDGNFVKPGSGRFCMIGRSGCWRPVFTFLFLANLRPDGYYDAYTKYMTIYFPPYFVNSILALSISI